ncbi:MAG: hypothetical protein ISQ16_03675 [Candidatus Actinomarina sp.]|nr:hypothetical protein [Candidatus Actinomarina sp.]MBL6762997.1 hypothetical protein [Candidatus Actinomarina sp.]
MNDLDLYNSLMKNLIYILLGAGFLAIVSSSASGFLTTETSNTLDNLYEETFYIDPENIEITNKSVVITLSQQNKNNAEKKINDCLNYYKKIYENLDINCNLVVKESIALNTSCVHKSGVYVKEETQEHIKITSYNDC